MKLLQHHKQAKEKRISEFNLIEWGLTAGAIAVLATALAQPKNPANMLRLPAAFAMFCASCIVERLREPEQESYDRAVQYEKNIHSELIQLDTVGHVELEKQRKAEQFFEQVPIDRLGELASKLGFAPPNHAARQADTMLQTPAQTPVATESKLPDPTGDFDPESTQPDGQQDSGMILISSDRVVEWFEQMGDAIPDSLRQEWLENPGKFIEIINGTARILR